MPGVEGWGNWKDISKIGKKIPDEYILGDLMFSIVTTVNSLIYYLKVAERVELQCSYHTHKIGNFVKCWRY